MFKEFLEWLIELGREPIFLVFIFSFIFFSIAAIVAFVAFIMPPALLRFELAMLVIMLSIFITWYLRREKVK